MHAQFNHTALSRNKKVLSSLANMLPWLVCQFLQHSDLISWTIGYIENYFVVGDLYSPPITNLKMLSLVSIPRCLIFFASLKHPQNPGCYLIIWLRVLCVCHGYETLNGSGLSQHIQHPLQNLEALACFFVAWEFLATSLGIIETFTGVGCSKTGTFNSSRVLGFFNIPWPIQINLMLSGLSDFGISFGQFAIRSALTSSTFLLKSVSWMTESPSWFAKRNLSFTGLAIQIEWPLSGKNISIWFAPFQKVSAK